MLILTAVTAAGCNSADSREETPAPASSTPATAEPSPSPTESPFVMATFLSTLKEDAGKFDSMSFDYTITDETNNFSQGSVWRQSGKGYKIELGNADGITQVSIIDLTEKTSVTYSPDAKTGIMFTLTDEAVESLSTSSSDMNILLPADYLEMISADTAEDLGVETLDGEECRVIQYPDEINERTVKMWVSGASGLPVKIVMTSTNEDDTTETEIINIKYGDLPADVFTVPADVLITDAALASASPSASPTVSGLESAEPTASGEASGEPAVSGQEE